MDAVIEIKQYTEDSSCAWECMLLTPWHCMAGWSEPRKDVEGFPYPTDKCPGPGRYRLVRVEDGDE